MHQQDNGRTWNQRRPRFSSSSWRMPRNDGEFSPRLNIGGWVRTCTQDIYRANPNLRPGLNRLLIFNFAFSLGTIHSRSLNTSGEPANHEAATRGIWTCRHCKRRPSLSDSVANLLTLLSTSYRQATFADFIGDFRDQCKSASCSSTGLFSKQTVGPALSACLRQASHRPGFACGERRPSPLHFQAANESDSNVNLKDLFLSR